MKSTRVKCNSCGKLFNIKKVHTEKDFPKGITIRYITCSNCGQKYLTEIFDWDMSILRKCVSYHINKEEKTAELKRRQRHLITVYSAYLKEKGISPDGLLSEEDESNE